MGTPTPRALDRTVPPARWRAVSRMRPAGAAAPAAESSRGCARAKPAPSARGSAGLQPHRLDAGGADQFVLVSGAAAGADRADHGALVVLDQHRTGLRDELAFGDRRDRVEEGRQILRALR